MSIKDKSEEPLKCDVTVDGLLQITIGINTLAYCAMSKNGGPIEEVFDEYDVKIDDNRRFAIDVSNSLSREDEVGNTMLVETLQDAMLDAVERGSSGIEYKKRKKKL